MREYSMYFARYFFKANTCRSILGVFVYRISLVRLVFASSWNERKGKEVRKEGKRNDSQCREFSASYQYVLLFVGKSSRICRQLFFSLWHYYMYRKIGTRWNRKVTYGFFSLCFIFLLGAREFHNAAAGRVQLLGKFFGGKAKVSSHCWPAAARRAVVYVLPSTYVSEGCHDRKKGSLFFFSE